MGDSTSHTKKDAKVLEETATLKAGQSTIQGQNTDIETNLDARRLDLGRLEAITFHRPRPVPYDTTATLTVTADAAADTFGLYAQLIAQGAYDFGDTALYGYNCIQVKQLVIESMSANDVYIIEFYQYDGATYTPVGAIRFVRAAVLPRSWTVETPCRCFNNNTHSLHARLKTAAGGSNITISLNVARIVHTDYILPMSTGVWPTG